jgi:hypothetical protein
LIEDIRILAEENSNLKHEIDELKVNRRRGASDIFKLEKLA